MSGKSKASKLKDKVKSPKPEQPKVQEAPESTSTEAEPEAVYSRLTDQEGLFPPPMSSVCASLIRLTFGS